MAIRGWLALAGVALLVACGREAAPAPEQDSGAAAPVGGGVFVDQPPADAQIVFVARDAADHPADRAGVFVPFSTFATERDGIPNEFPPADTMAAALVAAGVQGDRIVIVGEPIAAGRAFAALDYLGLGDRVVLLDGGADALGAEPVAAGGAGDATLNAHVRDDMIVDAEWIQARLDDPRVAILDARPADEFSGEKPGDGVTRPGHIPGARNVFWQTLVRSAEDSRLKDHAELRAIFEQAGVGPGDTIVSYCRTGGQASFLYAVARHLGYEVKLYDGSFVDWSRTDFPVER